MHQIPAGSRHLRMVDPDSVCRAAGALTDRDRVRRWAELLTVLGDPHRLSLLLSLHGAGELCVSDLAVAVGTSDSGVSHALRLLRAHGLVTVRREGRLARYRLAEGAGLELLELVAQSLPRPATEHARHHA